LPSEFKLATLGRTIPISNSLKFIEGERMRKASLWFCAAMAALLVCLAAALAQPGSRVKVGYCGPLKDIDAVKAAGFDYMEVRTSEVAALSDADFEKAAAKFRELGLPVLSANLFLPGDIKVTGPLIDKERQMEYVRRALLVDWWTSENGSRRKPDRATSLSRSSHCAIRRATSSTPQPRGCSG
jgi:hypothetical protein